MALKFAIQTVFEILLVVGIIYGFIKEDKLIAFEDKIKASIKNRRKWLNEHLTPTKAEFALCLFVILRYNYNRGKSERSEHEKARKKL